MNIEVLEEDQEPRFELVEHLELLIGSKIGFCDKDDYKHWEFMQKDGCQETWEEFKSQICFVGIVLPPPDFEIRGASIEPEKAIICIIDYSCEKCYPETTYITLGRLLDEDIYEIFEV